MELSTALPASASLYVLGESTRPNGFALPRNGSVLTLWARDSPAALPQQNTYSAWPFYMDVRAGARALHASRALCVKKTSSAKALAILEHRTEVLLLCSPESSAHAARMRDAKYTC